MKQYGKEKQMGVNEDSYKITSKKALKLYRVTKPDNTLEMITAERLHFIGDHIVAFIIDDEVIIVLNQHEWKRIERA